MVLSSWCGAEAHELQFSPVSGQVSSPFGWRIDPITGSSRFHGGLDIAAPAGMPVYTTQAGTVVFSGEYGGYGKVVVIHHGDTLYTLYGHNSQLLVSPGQPVARGQQIALVGSTGRSTGPHLHFEVHYRQQYVNPLNYLAQMQSQGPMLAQAAPPKSQFGNIAAVQNGQGGPAYTSSSQGARIVNRAQVKTIRRGRTGKTVQVVNGDDIQNIQF